MSAAFRIEIPLVTNLWHKKPKAPGSLGYGLYTFMEGLSDPRKLARSFSDKFSGNTYVLEITSQIDEQRILNLNNQLERQSYRKFYHQSSRTAQIICNNLGFQMNTRKQHVFDGVMLELYIHYLSRRHIAIDGVIHDTVTDVNGDGLSDIENGREFCIRARNIIAHREIVD